MPTARWANDSNSQAGRGSGILLGKGAERRSRDLEAYDQAPHDYASGVRKFEFDRNIYAHKSVREALRTAQHDKCCFCESKISHVGADDVEHFRPKGGIRQQRHDDLIQPGYYWLAYVWSNLYLACEDCNQRSKENLFPINHPNVRPRSHHDSTTCDDEQPIFIDPGDHQIDPEQLIGFREGEPYPIDGNERAKKTINELELGRQKLMEQRNEHVRLLELFSNMITWFRAGDLRGPKAASLVQKAANELAARTEDRAQFTATARHFLRDRLHRDLRFSLSATELIGYAHGGSFPTLMERPRNQ